MRLPPSRRLAQLLTLGAAGVLAWWACAPMVGTMPSPAPLADRGPGTTVAVSYGKGLEETCTRDPETWERDCGWGLAPGTEVLTGHLAYGGKRRGAWEFGVLGGGGKSAWGYLGGYGRHFFADEEGLQAGVELQLGGLWAAVGFPLAVRLGPDIWLTSSPSFGYRQWHTVRVPVGLSADLSEHVRLNVELSGGGVELWDFGFFSENHAHWAMWGTVGLTFH